MYVGVDIGGTKTLVAVLDEHGVIKEQTKFPTSQNYNNWLLELRHAAAHLKIKDFKAGGLGVPGVLDRVHGIGLTFGNLAWERVHILRDTEKLFGCPFVMENDAKMAGLSEAMLLKGEFHKVCYVTVSTGIGYALVVDGVIDSSVGDGGGRALLLEHRGKMTSWEDFAGGKAIVKRYGKKAMDITDQATWKKISRDLARGFVELIAVMEPEVIVIGGSVGTYFERYGKLITADLKNYEVPMVVLPVLRQAQRPEQAVVYGCYDLAKQTYGHA